MNTLNMLMFCFIWGILSPCILWGISYTNQPHLCLGRHLACTKDPGNGLYDLNISYTLQISHKCFKHAPISDYLERIAPSHIMGDFLYEPATLLLGRHSACTKDLGNGSYGLNVPYTLQASHKYFKHAPISDYFEHTAPSHTMGDFLYKPATPLPRQAFSTHQRPWQWFVWLKCILYTSYKSQIL